MIWPRERTRSERFHKGEASVRSWKCYVVVLMSGLLAWGSQRAACAQGTAPAKKSQAATATGVANSSNASPLSKEISNSIGMKLELIPAGEFVMGGGEKAEDLVKAFPQYGIAADFLA